MRLNSCRLMLCVTGTDGGRHERICRLINGLEFKPPSDELSVSTAPCWLMLKLRERERERKTRCDPTRSKRLFCFVFFFQADESDEGVMGGVVGKHLLIMFSHYLKRVWTQILGLTTDSGVNRSAICSNETRLIGRVTYAQRGGDKFQVCLCDITWLSTSNQPGERFVHF